MGRVNLSVMVPRPLTLNRRYRREKGENNLTTPPAKRFQGSPPLAKKDHPKSDAKSDTKLDKPPLKIKRESPKLDKPLVKIKRESPRIDK